MSVDSRCIVKHKERNPVDAAVIRLFVAASEFVANQVIIISSILCPCICVFFYLCYLSLFVYLTNITNHISVNAKLSVICNIYHYPSICQQ